MRHSLEAGKWDGMGWLLRHCPHKVCDARGQHGERSRLGAGDGAQEITWARSPGQARNGDTLGEENGPGASMRGRWRGRQLDWQPTRPPCHPQQEGISDKRTELSGGWNTGSEGGGAQGSALQDEMGAA